MSDRLDLPDDLLNLIEKREQSDRRKEQDSDYAGEERRSGEDRREGEEPAAEDKGQPE